MTTNIAVQNLKPQKCLVVGDIMIDRYLEGKISRISPEAPVPILDYQSSEDRLGGAANVALNLKAFNCQIHIASVCGNDDDGKFLKEKLAYQNIDSSSVFLSDQRRTTLKTRLMTNHQQLMRVDQEDQFDLMPDEFENLQSLIDNIFTSEKLDFIILEDYNKGVLSKPMIDWIIKRARSLGINIFVDPKKKNFFEYQGVTVFKPNLRELKEAFGLNDKNINSEKLDEISEVLLERINCEGVLITLGEKGIYYRDRSNRYEVDGVNIDISDVCGAGDTVISSFAALYNQIPIKENLIFSNNAAAQVCRVPGVVPFAFNILT